MNTKNSFLGAVLGSEYSPGETSVVLPPSPPMPAGPNPLRYPPDLTVRRETAARSQTSPPVKRWTRSAGSTGRRPRCFFPKRPTGGEKSSPWVPPASPRLAGFRTGFISVKPLDCVSFTESEQPKVQLLTVDHSARGSMKTAANCVS